MVTPSGVLVGSATAQDGFDQCPVDPADVGLVLDRSGSMTGEPIEAARDGASHLASGLTAEHQSGLVSYSSSATLDDPMSFDHASTVSAIESLTAGGSTATGDAIDLSHDDFQNNARTGVRDVMILLTDGITNTGSDPVVQAQQAKDDDIEIYAIGLGSNVNEQELREIATSPDHFHQPQTTDDLLAVFDELLRELVPVPDNRGTSTAVHAELSVPANPELDVVRSEAGPGDDHATDELQHVDLPAPLDGHVKLANGTAATSAATGERTAFAEQTISELVLFGGDVRVENLHAVARAETLSGETSTDASESEMADVTVQGQQLGPDVPANTEIPLDGYGTLILKEVRTDSTADKHSEVQVNMVHLVLDDARVRGELVVGQAYAATTCDPSIGTLIGFEDNDAGTGTDAGDTPDQATGLDDPALVQGRLVDPGDRSDHYAVQVEPGEKIQAEMLPSTRAEVETNGTVDGTSTSAHAPNFDLYLREPGTYQVREQSTLLLSSPERVELNVDTAGLWILEVRRSAGHGNYTLSTTVSPVPLLDQNDGLSGADAPDACPNAVDIESGLHPGVLKGDDYNDFYRIPADIGDLFTAALKPTEDADGANFDLYLYDGDCHLLQSSTLGSGLVPKGTPDPVTMLPVAVSQDYFLEVRRVNGIGNYYLTVDVQDPQPTVGPLDAEPSGDAGSGPSEATPVERPVAAQGSFPDDDHEDWYSFDAEAGENLTVTMKPSETSDFDIALVDPDGNVQASSQLPSSAPEGIVHEVETSGTWYLVVDRDTGGGDYLFTIAGA